MNISRKSLLYRIAYGENAPVDKHGNPLSSSTICIVFKNVISVVLKVPIVWSIFILFESMLVFFTGRSMTMTIKKKMEGDSREIPPFDDWYKIPFLSIGYVGTLLVGTGVAVISALLWQNRHLISSPPIQIWNVSVIMGLVVAVAIVVLIWFLFTIFDVIESRIYEITREANLILRALILWISGIKDKVCWKVDFID